MSAKSERASLPDRVEAAHIPDKRLAEIRDELARLLHVNIAAANPYGPRLTLALIAELQERRAADACEAERNPNTTDEYVQVIFGRAEDIEADRAFVFCWVNSNRNPPPEGFVPLFVRRPVSSEDVHREERT